MSEPVHLKEAEKLELARGLVEYGSTLDHLDECAACADAVERLREAEEERLLDEASTDAPSEWFREAGAAAVKEMDAALASVTATEDAARGTASDAESRVSRERVVPLHSGNGRPRAFAAAAAITAVAAALVLLLRRPGEAILPSEPTESRGEDNARSGGVSADLYCSARGDMVLGPSDWCPVGAALKVFADKASGDGGLSLLTVVECRRDVPCKVVSSSQFGGKAALEVPGPRMSSGAPLEVIVVWSDRAIESGVLSNVTHAKDESFERPRLSLPGAWGQVGFLVRATD